MRQWIRAHLTYANVLATIAVFLVLSGGTAIAAQSVLINNDSSQPVPVQEQRTNANGNIKVHEEGTANVNVQGTVPISTKLPANAFSDSGVGVGPAGGGDISSNIECPNLPVGTTWYISSMSGTMDTGIPDGDHSTRFRAFLDTTGELDDVAGPSMAVSPADTVQLTFPQPFVMRQTTDDMCLRVVASTGAVIHVRWTIVGYHD